MVKQRNLHVERVLFVAARQNSGKSVALRNMFQDRRFGQAGTIPEGPRLKPVYLSNERRLSIRLTAPHEWKNKSTGEPETMEIFLQKTAASMKAGGRWCFACPLHLEPLRDPRKNDGKLAFPELIEEFVGKFSPERTRIAFLSPGAPNDYNDNSPRLLSEQLAGGQPGVNRLVDRLRKIRGVECIFLDARHRNERRARKKNVNGMVLADFFDFT
jgi:hypothetical protein